MDDLFLIFEKENTNLTMKENNYIPSIFNYCDRWCERCDFTSQCRTYDMGRELGVRPSQHFTSVELWKFLQQSFYKNKTLLQQLIDEDGTDWHFFQQKETTSLGKHKGHLFGEKNSITQSSAILHRLAKDYVNKYHTWRKANEDLLEKSHEQPERISDIIEVIGWYGFFISAKVARAISGLSDEAYLKEEPIQNDMNGSAKIAIIALERSMAAWIIFMKKFPNQKEDAIDMLSTLAPLWQGLQIEFPNYKDFIRPGLDNIIGSLASD